MALQLFMFLKLNRLYREYLFVYLKTQLALSQLGRPVVGAMYPTLKKQYIKELIIPIIAKEKQGEISCLVKQFFSPRKEAKELIEQV